MKYIIWLFILGIVGFFAYTQLFKPLSEEEMEVKKIEAEFNAAVKLFVAASRQMGESGLVAIADPEAAVVKVMAAKEKLTALMTSLEEEKAIQRAEELEAKILEFYRKNDIE